MLTLQSAVELLSQYIGANKEPKIQIYLAADYFLKCGDPVGSLERVTFTVTADANGEGFITLPNRYETIRGAVENPTSTSVCGWPIRLRNDYYEFQPGNLGMVVGTSESLGIIPIQLTQTDTTTYLDAGLVARHFKVPVCPTENEQSFFTLICKRASIYLTDDDAILPVWNLQALTYGLKALDKRDSEDYAREKELWELGKACLAEEKENEVGPETLGKVQMDDDFCLSGLGQEGWGWNGYGWYGNWE